MPAKIPDLPAMALADMDSANSLMEVADMTTAAGVSKYATFSLLAQWLRKVGFGVAITAASPAAVAWGFTNGSGADNAAGNFSMTAPLSTGNATPARFIFNVGIAGSTGSTLQTARSVLEVSATGVVIGMPSRPALGSIAALTETGPNRFVTYGDGVNGSARFTQVNIATANIYRFLYASGTIATPTAPAISTAIGGMTGGAFNGTSWIADAAQLTYETAEAWGVGTNGTQIRFYVTPVGSSTSGIVFSVENTGGLTQVMNSVNSVAFASTGYSLTGSNASTGWSHVGTWNTSGNPTAMLVNITNTASGSTAKLMDLQASSVSQFSVGKDGSTLIPIGKIGMGTTPGTGGGLNVDANSYGSVAVSVTSSGTETGRLSADASNFYVYASTSKGLKLYSNGITKWTIVSEAAGTSTFTSESATARIVGGATNGLAIRNSGNTRDNFVVSDDGNTIAFSGATYGFSIVLNAAVNEIGAGVFLRGSNAASGIFLHPSTNTGAGIRAGIAYYTGTGATYYSAAEVANVASGFGTLALMKSGGSTTVAQGGVGTGAAGSALAVNGTADNNALQVLKGTFNPSYASVSGAIIGLYAYPTLAATANSQSLYAYRIDPTFTPGAFTGLVSYGLRISGWSTAAYTTPGDPIGLQIGIITGTGATNAAALELGIPTGASNNYLIKASTTATFNVTAAGAITSASNIIAGAGSIFNWTGRSSLASTADGLVVLYNNAATDFGRLMFGGTTSSFPALKRSATAIEVRLADDSGYASFTPGTTAVQGTLTSTSKITAGVGTAITAGGSTVTSLCATSTSNFGTFFGSGVPTIGAAKGSLYLRSDGSGTTNRAYINTDGGTTWTALTTVA